MTQLACGVVRELLSAFVDQELAVEEQIAVELHLHTCPFCAAEAESLREVGQVLRETGADARGDRCDLAGLATGVVSRLRAECDQSIASRFERLFDDWHLVWAAVGATAATLLCAVVVNALLLLTTQMRPNSMAAVLAGLASVGSNANPAWLSGSILVPRVDADTVMPAAIVNHGRSEDAMFALAAVVTREGTLSNVELLGRDGRFNPRIQRNRQDLLDLLDAAATARFEPARYAGSPVAVNVIWLLAHTTVRGRAIPVVRPADKESPAGPLPLGAGRRSRRSSLGIVGV